MQAALLTTLQDGRQLAFAEYGERSGRPLLVLHGTPGGRTQLAALDRPARLAGVRIIAPDRPGLGYSDPWPALDFAKYAGDVRQLLDHLQIPRAALAGLSGGGAFALACARELPARISRAILVAGMAPTPAALRKAMPLQSRVLFLLSAHCKWLAAALMKRAYLGDPDSPSLRRTIALMPAADRRVLERADVRELLWGAPSRDSLRQGVDAAIRELALFAQPLGFDLREINMPIHLIHGDADVNVPIEIARYLAEQIPGATLKVIAGAGHLFLFESPQLMFEFA